MNPAFIPINTMLFKLGRRMKRFFSRLRVSPLSLAGLILLIQIPFLGGCAGPTTPLGAVYAIHPVQVNVPRISLLASRVLMHDTEAPVDFYPERQILHGAFPLSFVIKDAQGLDKIMIRHNGLDVTTAFLLQAHVKKGKAHVFVSVPHVRLSPDRHHQIEIIYQSSRGVQVARLEPPRCSSNEISVIENTGRFKPNQDMVTMIDRMARQSRMNPVFVSALVAQESGFNPRTVSWAKAMGLTQVTALADEELQIRHQHFANLPRYPGIESLPYPWIQTLVATGRINASNEWRLDPEKSLQGGMAYISFLMGRWDEPENKELILKIFGPDEYEAARDQLVLASYNSGFARVWTSLNRMEYSWITAKELQEARRYVGRIFSYCEQFSNSKQRLLSPDEIWGYYHENET